VIKRFLLKKYAHLGTYDNKSREKIGQAAAWIGIVSNICLFLFKLIAGLITSSIAIISDGINNLSDAASSVVTMVGFKLSNAPAHKEHPFGHGRMEYIAGLIVAMIIILMGFELGKGSVEKIITPQAITYSHLSLIILLVAIGVKLWLFILNKTLAKEIRSQALHAVALDSISDAVATAVVALGLVIFRFTGYNIDAWLGLVVSALILYNGVNSAKSTLSPLLGESADEEMGKEIEEMALALPHIVGVHDLLVHNYGPGRSIISLHAEMNSSCDIITAHDYLDELEQRLRKKFNCQAVIHLDPIMLDDALTQKVLGEVTMIVKEADERMEIHDFRVIKGANRLNIVFDLVIPYDLAADKEAVNEDIRNRITTYNSSYCAVIEVEHKF